MSQGQMSVHDLVASFADATLQDWRKTSERDLTRLAEIVEEELGASGLLPVTEILGYGAMGTAASLAGDPNLVLKLTTDTAEAHVAAYLAATRFEHPNLVRFDKAFGVKTRTRPLGSSAFTRIPFVGVILREAVDQVVRPGLDQDINLKSTRIYGAILDRIKADHGIYPSVLAALPIREQRRRVRRAAMELHEAIRTNPVLIEQPVTRAIMDAIGALSVLKIYVVDLHLGNIGWSRRGREWKAFDLGITAVPPKAVRSLRLVENPPPADMLTPLLPPELHCFLSVI